MQFDELFLLRLFVHLGGENGPKLKEKHPTTPLGWIKDGFLDEILPYFVVVKCNNVVASGPESQFLEMKWSANNQLIDNTTLLLHKIVNNESQRAL